MFSSNYFDDVQVFPNPGAEKITVSAQEEMTIQIMNEVGMLVRTVQLDPSNHFSVSVDQLPQGMYFARSSSRLENRPVKFLILH